MTNKGLRVVAAAWFVIAALSSLYFFAVATAIIAGRVPGRESDATLVIAMNTGAAMMVSWTAGLAMSWMANISDDLRAKAGR